MERTRFPEHRTNEQPRLRMEVAVRRAESVLAAHFPRIVPEDFTHYSPEMIARDAADVEKVKESWSESSEVTPEGIVAEAFVFDMIGRAQWFGEHSSIVRTSEYDDFFNHIDALVSIHIEQSDVFQKADIGLALDATTNQPGVKEKLAEIIGRIKIGTMGVAKYAKTDDFIGEMRRLPEAVLFIDHDSFKDVIARWVLPDSHALPGVYSEEERKERFHELARHRLQLEFLVQIYVQMQTFYKFGKHSVREKLRATQQVVFYVLQERMAALGMSPTDLPTLLEAPSVVAMRTALQEVSEKRA